MDSPVTNPFTIDILTPTPPRGGLASARGKLPLVGEVLRSTASCRQIRSRSSR